MSNDLEALAQSMSPSLLLKAIILARTEPFSYVALADAVRAVTPRFPYLSVLTEPGCDGTPDHNTPIDSDITRMLGSSFLEYVDQFSHLRMVENSHDFVARHLREKYGDSVLESLRPVTDAIWQAYRA